MERRICFTVASCLFSLGGSVALAADIPSDLDYYKEFPVVLSAARLQQPLAEAPNAMTVIDRAMIAASGFRTIPDLFKLVPGMYVSYYKGSQAVVSYHGSTDQNARRMQVLIDGRSVYMPPVSTVDWARLPITVDDIERIEVIRGPAAASHGANSTQGVISITTRSPGTGSAGAVSITHGNKGISDQSARLDVRGELFDYRLTLARSADEGYDDLFWPPNDIPITKGQAVGLLNNSYDSNQAQLVNFRGDYHPNAVDRFDIQFGASHDVQGVGFNDKTPNAITPKNTNGNPFHDLHATAAFAQLGWVRRLADASELSVVYYHARSDSHESLPVYLSGVLFADPPVTQALQTSRDNIEVQHIVPLSASNRLVYGAGYRVDRVNGQGNIPPLPPPYSSSFKTTEYRLFAHDEWRITPKVLLNAGAMLERDWMGRHSTSPRVATIFHVTPQHSVRVGASVANRTPSLIEQHLQAPQPGAVYVPGMAVTSPGLVPEKLVSREIAYLGDIPEWQTLLDLRVFSDHVSNGVRISNQRTFTNGLNSEFHGFEVSAKHSFRDSSYLIVNFAHELAGSNCPSLFAAGERGCKTASPWIDDLLAGSTPRHSASLLYSRRLAPDLALSAALYYQDAMQPFDRGSIDFQPIQRRIDLRVVKTLTRTGGIGGTLALVVQNLFDTGYTEYAANNVFNRRAYLTLNLNW